jgi:general secretion pathway protein H
MVQKVSLAVQESMKKLVIGMQNKQGFTLIELMIVLVILSITFTFALIAFGDFGESKRILFSAEQLVNNLRFAQYQAILETSTFGLRIDNAGYQILRFNPNAQWSVVSNQSIFKPFYFPKNTLITVYTDNHPRPGKPTIIISASGSLTPFKIIFGSNKENKVAILSGSAQGDLNLNSVSLK